MRTEDSTMRPELTRLSDLDEYEIEEGYPDIRGWTLYDETGRDIGEVRDLLVDTRRDAATYATIDLNDTTWQRDLFGERADARVPLDAMTIDENAEAVRLTQPLASVVGAGVAAPETTARPGEGETVEVVEEQLDIEKARRKAGEVRVGKEVETETVRREVPVEHEEVIVERETLDRPAAATEAGRAFESGEGEISVPVYREEVEVTKRPVVTERLRIRKRMVEDTREVAADVRKERATVEGEGEIRETDRPGTEAKGQQTGKPRRPTRPS